MCANTRSVLITNVSSLLVLDVEPTGSPMIQLFANRNNSDYNSFVRTNLVRRYRSSVPGGQLLAPSESASVIFVTSQDSIQVQIASAVTVARIAVSRFAGEITREAYAHRNELNELAYFCAEATGAAAGVLMGQGELNLTQVLKIGFGLPACIPVLRSLEEDENVTNDELVSHLVDEPDAKQEIRNSNEILTRTFARPLQTRRVRIAEVRP